MKNIDSRKQIVGWFIKLKFLQDQIVRLEDLKNFPAVGVAVFLLKAQLIEFELKQLVAALDLHAHLTHQPWWTRKKARTPVQLDQQRLTLGGLKTEIGKYQFEFLEDINTNLPELVRLRNEFVHSLFSLGSIEHLIKNSEAGLRIAKQVIRNIHETNTYLGRNDPL